MRGLLIGLLSLSFTVKVFGQHTLPDSGFTNKAEANNKLVNGVKEGKWMEYTNGQIIVTDTMSLYRLGVYRNGKLTGIVREYNCLINTLFSICNYKDGKENGMKVYFFTDGKDTLGKTPYLNGLKNGLVESFYGEHKLMHTRMIKDDKANGVDRNYYRNGKVGTETFYYDDKKNGIEKDYDSTGIITSETPYLNDTINGTQKLYYLIGNLAMEIPYFHGIKNGIEKEYYENGKLKSEVIYKMGILGATKNYDENGKEIK